MRHKIKDEKQKEARDILRQNNGSGLIAMATGCGKSKIAIDESKEIVAINKKAKILIVVPTEKLRDVNWKEEFEKWRAKSVYNKNVERSCYISANKIKDQEFDLVILDEAHNITENNSQFFENNEVKRIIALTATPPNSPEKVEILEKYGIKTIYHIPIDEAVELGLVSPYKITIVETRLDDKDKYIEIGTYKFTESSRYSFLSRTINSLMYKTHRTRAEDSNLKFRIFDRMRLIYNLRSKVNAAKILLENVVPKNERTLIFCGSIEQTLELADHRFFSKPSYKKGNKKSEERAKKLMPFYKKDEDFNAFKEEKINRLACINALNEGHNIPNVDNAVIVQLNSNEKDLVQRMGRIVRWRRGHIGHIYVIVCVDTVDEKWMRKAISGLDMQNIEFVRINNYEQN